MIPLVTCPYRNLENVANCSMFFCQAPLLGRLCVFKKQHRSEGTDCRCLFFVLQFLC